MQQSLSWLYLELHTWPSSESSHLIYLEICKNCILLIIFIILIRMWKRYQRVQFAYRYLWKQVESRPAVIIAVFRVTSYQGFKNSLNFRILWTNKSQTFLWFFSVFFFSSSFCIIYNWNFLVKILCAQYLKSGKM